MSVKNIVVCDYCNAEIVNSLAFSISGDLNSFNLSGFDLTQHNHVHDYCAEAELKSWLHKREEERIKENGLQNYNER